MSTETIMAALAKECDWCKHVNEAIDQLRKALYNARNYGIVLTACHQDHDGMSHGSPHRITTLAAVCRNCSGKRRVLTQEGQQLLSFLVEQGVITGAELAARKGQADEG